MRRIAEAAENASPAAPLGDEGQLRSDESNMVSALLWLWAKGDLSAAMVQHICLQATLDGCAHPEVMRFASFGGAGEHTANTTRDIKTYLNNKYPFKIPEACVVEGPVLHSQKGK